MLQTMSTMPEGQYWNQSCLFEDPFLAKIAGSAAMGRLKDIGFLGAIDYLQFCERECKSRHSYNRYEHSIGVANLALLYAKIRGLPENESRVLAAAGLLHDIGHGPLSHSLEPIFEKHYGITHHACGKEILFGRSVYGSEIIDTMTEFGIDIEEVVAMIEGYHNGSHAFLYASPINVDTIDGICRTKKFVDIDEDSANIDPRSFVISLAESHGRSTGQTDKFWSIKNEVYNQILHSHIGLLFDGLAQAYMQSKISDFSVEDFLTTERDLEHSHPLLFELLNVANRSIREAYDYVKRCIPELLGYTLRAMKREFQIVVGVQVRNSSELKLRYTQTKTFRDVTVEELMNHDIS